MNVFYTLVFIVVLAEILFFPILEWVKTLTQGAVVYVRLHYYKLKIKRQMKKFESLHHHD